MTFAVTLQGVRAAAATRLSLLQSIFSDGTAPATLHVTGDSTSNDPIDWVFKLTDLIAARKPTYTTKYHLWNKTSQRWGSFSQRTAGTAGNRSATLGATAAARFNATLDSSGLTDLDLRVKAAAADWTPTGSAALVGADAGDPNRVFWLYLLNSGKLRLYWFPLGTNASAQFVDSTAATGLVNGNPRSLRVTLDVDNGAGGHDVKFYTAASNGSWVQLGATITTAGVTNLAAATSNFGIGARGTSPGINGAYYWCELRDAINSVGVTALWDASYYDGVASFQGLVGEVWTPTGTPSATGALGFRVHNASQSGQTSLGWNTAPAFVDAHAVTPDVYLLNLGHNDGAALDIVDYTALLDAIELRWPGTRHALVRQNDEPGGAPNQAAHQYRQMLIRDLAASRRLSVLNADAALREYGPTWSLDLMNDWVGSNVHPNALGGTQIAERFDVWASQTRRVSPLTNGFSRGFSAGFRHA